MSALGYVLITVGIASILYPVLISGHANVSLFPGSLLQSLDRLTQAIVVSAGIPVLATNLPLPLARLVGVLIFALGAFVAAAARWRGKQREIDWPAKQEKRVDDAIG